MSVPEFKPEYEGEEDPEYVTAEVGPEFGFRVQKELRDYNGNPVPPTYKVYLPHQCDAWEIAYEAGQPKAVEEMELFIKEAQATLEFLKSLEETS